MTTVGWTFDTTAPSVAITSPVDGTPFGADWPGAVTGTVSAASGLSVDDVDLTIHDVTADSYWNGVTWQPTATEVEAPTTSSWSYTLAAGELTTHPLLRGDRDGDRLGCEHRDDGDDHVLVRHDACRSRRSPARSRE